VGANELLEGEHLVEVPGIQNPPLATPSVIYADYMRELGSAGGEQDYVVPARVQTVTPMPPRCLRRLSVRARRQQLKLERADRARGVVLLFGNSSYLFSVETYSELIGRPPFLVSGGEPPSILGVPHERPANPHPDVVTGSCPMELPPSRCSPNVIPNSRSRSPPISSRSKSRPRFTTAGRPSSGAMRADTR